MELKNKRMFFELTQCLLRNFDPYTMEVTLPDVFNDIKGEETEMIETIHSVPNIPKVNLIILGNRMIGPSVVQHRTKKTAYTQDIVKNFHANSSLSSTDMS